MSMWPTSRDEAEPFTEEAIALFGAFCPGATDWLLPFLLVSAGPSDWNTYTSIVRGGDPVSDEEKSVLGHPGWFKFGRPCWDRMTDVGRRDPKMAVDQLLDHIFWRQRLIHRRGQFTDLLQSGPAPGRPLYPEVAISANHLCCSAAQAITGKSFSYQDYPDLPLPGCDKLWCKCDWKNIRRRR